jgi:CYTH domain-containing protein
MKAKNKLHCLIYRIRKTVPDVRIETKTRTVCVDLNEYEYELPDMRPRIAVERKIKRLIEEFHFVVQLEIR